MKKLMNVVLVCTVAMMFIGCLDDNPPYWYFNDEPAIVQYKNEKPMIQTAYGQFSAPMLDKTLSAGSYLWTNFSIDMGNQPTSADTTVTNLQYVPIGGSTLRIASGDMTDEYSDSIKTAVLYSGSIIGDVYFFGFEQVVPASLNFNYEIICNTDSVQQIDGQAVQTLYIRSKQSPGPASGSNTVNTRSITHYGFDMSDFIHQYKKDNQITFNVKYKTGMDSNGKDVYKPFQSNPITLYVR